MTDMTVSRTILEQLGGDTFRMITGANGFVGTDNALFFRVSGKIKAGAVNRVRITLDGNDTYTVQSFYVRGLTMTQRAKVSGVYCDMLRHEFELASGLFASFNA